MDVHASSSGARQARDDPLFLPADSPSIASQEREGSKKRKQVLLALIDELENLRDEESKEEKEINANLTNNERILLEAEGVEKLQAFDARVRALDTKLQSFSIAVSLLESSVGLSNAAYQLRVRLSQVQYLFQKNASDLFGAIPQGINIGFKPYSVQAKSKVQGRPNSMAKSKSRTADIDELPNELEGLAGDLGVFWSRLNDVPVFTDESESSSISSNM